MKVLNVLFICVAVFLPNISKSDVVSCNIDEYVFKMKVAVPRIYDNTTSKGYRKYNTQLVTGKMLICYPTDKRPPVIIMKDMVNQTHRLSNGSLVVYDNVTVGCSTFPTRLVLCGNNATGRFEHPSLCFYMDAEPNYNVGEDDPDNSLLITLAGRGYTSQGKYGRYISYMRGYLAGTQGCGCSAYGHTSPTRVAGWRGPTCEVSDPAAVYGIWKCKIERSYCGEVEIEDEEY